MDHATKEMLVMLVIAMRDANVISDNELSDIGRRLHKIVTSRNFAALDYSGVAAIKAVADDLREHRSNWPRLDDSSSNSDRDWMLAHDEDDFPEDDPEDQDQS